ncbi:MAG: 16S rRNA (uracil(1498)-N(3))-methyltransferase [Sulfurimonadaceae bacterium]|nr:16S rRNA (uracil(1498)-N(3))-methyltransferase [Sulfurimonadaceae bacterium]
MIFLFHEDASKERITIKGETYKYLIKVRRHQVGDTILMRSMACHKDLYHYEITSIDAREAVLELKESELKEVKPSKNLHIAWCAIDPKSVEKVLPTLSEIGVNRISFIYCERSQKNFKPDFKRLERILESSMMQSGRSTMMKLGIYKNLKEFLKEFPDTKVFDFTDRVLDGDADFETVLIGCEGGFSHTEKELLASQEVFRLDTPMVLRSESAAVAIASKILL